MNSVLCCCVQLLCHVGFFAAPWTAACQASLSFAISRILLTHVHLISNAIQPCHPLSPPSLPTLNLSQHQDLFQWVGFFASGGQNIGASALATVLPMNIQGWFPLELTGLISLLFKGLSRVLLQTFVNKVMTLDFNTLSRFVIVFLSRSKCLLISWLQSSSPVILEP